MRRVLWTGAFLVLFELGFCGLCPDLSPGCYNISISSEKNSLCNLKFIQDICRETCPVDRVDCSTTCSTFNYTGYEAFIFYAIGLFLLLIIGILSYSYCVDSRPLQGLVDFASSSMQKKKEIQLAGPIKLSESSQGLGSNPNIDSLDIISSPSDYYGDEQRNRNERDPWRSIFADEMKRPSWKVIDPYSRQVAPMNSYPASVMKGSIIGSHELEEADGAEYIDDDDDFFKYALLPEDDSCHSDFVPPAPCRVGGPRQSQALSKKLKARDAAHSKGNEGIGLLPSQQEAHKEPRVKKRRNGAQVRSVAPNENNLSLRNQPSSDHLSTPAQSNKFAQISADHRERQSNVNRVNETLTTLSEVIGKSDLPLFGEPSEDQLVHKRPVINQIDSKKDWYALGQGHTRERGGSCASEGMEPQDHPQKTYEHEGIEQGNPSDGRSQEIPKVNED